MAVPMVAVWCLAQASFNNHWFPGTLADGLPSCMLLLHLCRGPKSHADENSPGCQCVESLRKFSKFWVNFRLLLISELTVEDVRRET